MGSSAAPSSTLVYAIDASDRICRIEGDWDGFARDNRAPELTRGRVLGSSFWQFIEGFETAEIHRLLFSGVRERGVRVRLPFRCDTPWLRRDMEMVVCPGADDGIEIASTVLAVKPRPYVALLDAAARRSTQLVKICSWCKKIAVPSGGWVEVEEAVRDLKLLVLPPVPQMTHGMCEACQEGFRRQIAVGAGRGG